MYTYARRKWNCIGAKMELKQLPRKKKCHFDKKRNGEALENTKRNQFLVYVEECEKFNLEAMISH